jgi:hypothetical protein
MTSAALSVVEIIIADEIDYRDTLNVHFGFSNLSL